MKSLAIVVLLSSAALLCSSAPVLEAVTCTEDSGAPAARLAMHHINEQHNHGYKFRLSQIQGNKVEKVGEGCNIELQLNLQETVCHVVNPKHFEDCELRRETDQAVMANCTVTMTVENGEAKITKYRCDTRKVKTNAELTAICPDCPTLIPLNSTEGVDSVKAAVAKFNENTTNENYYILLEVGRIRSGFSMASGGMEYYAEFALVETQCPQASRINPEACRPLCSDSADHAFCTSTSSTKGLESIECEYYPPLNTTAPGPDDRGRRCRHHHHHHEHHHHGPPPHAHDHGHGPPPHAGRGGPPPHAHDHGQGPPPHAGRGGPPPHAHDHGHGPPPHAGPGGPPSQAHDHGHGPPPHAGRGGPPPNGHDHGHGHPPHTGRGRFSRAFRPCHGFITNPDPALHPICPWPLPDPRNNPKPSQS
ncbi:alpha-2-HS-glycoprotein 1 [Toxotes jaculatrix]|uniref:alpha-2-HS-glycoprotein 1 n=1 Tax=Toxotes jaculatrix TaxID=941984 RepID=UPI001B3AECDF|nr:alpha-2-HS-glycoprotein 1 [Toxotes jaculatrix]